MRHPPKGHPPVSALRSTLSTVALATTVVVGALVRGPGGHHGREPLPRGHPDSLRSTEHRHRPEQHRRGLGPHHRCLDRAGHHLPDPLRLVVAGMHHGRAPSSATSPGRHPGPVVRRRRRRRPRRRQRGLPAEPHQHRGQLPDHHRLLGLRRGGRLRPERGSRRLGGHPGPRPGRVRSGTTASRTRVGPGPARHPGPWSSPGPCSTGASRPSPSDHRARAPPRTGPGPAPSR